MRNEKELERIYDIEADSQGLESRKDIFLLNAGWKYNCDFPDSCWRWCKQLDDGRIICTSKKDAVALQKFLYS